MSGELLYGSKDKEPQGDLYVPEGVEMDAMLTQQRKQVVFVCSADEVILALEVARLDIVVLLCYFKPFLEHLDGEIGHA